MLDGELLDRAWHQLLAATGGAIRLGAEALLDKSPAELRALRASRMAMIFQEPMTALNPVFTVGDQLSESLIVHRGMTKAQAKARALALLREVRIPEPERRLNQYPHELSGGMRQRVVIAMAGTHQLFDFDPVAGVLAVHAGTGLEGLLDGDAGSAWFAQTSGLSVGPDGTLWAADSETSAVRWLRTGEDGRREVGTAVGTGLFDFGFVDGEAAQARLQHPLGVAVLPDGSIAVADTYNGAIRRWDPVEGQLSTLERDFDEHVGRDLV